MSQPASRTKSMTGYASQSGAKGAATWTWEMRGVNAKGLDLRLRLPDVVGPTLEPRLRAQAAGQLARGNVSLTLRLDTRSTEAGLTLDDGQLDAVLTALDRVQSRALDRGITLGQPTAADVLSQRGVIRQGSEDVAGAEIDALITALAEDFDPLLASFCAMRAAEGASLHRIISAQLDEIETLIQHARVAASARGPKTQEALSRALARVTQEGVDVEPQRIAQELALIAVKADITEEIDRLGAHVAAGRDLMNSDAAKGRKLDFLAQEFNREANTLCAKSQDTVLTTIGLDLKVVIDQMREQIQNVE